MSLYGVLNGKTPAEVEAEFEGQGYGTLKKALLGEVLATLKPLQTRYAEIMADEAGLERSLQSGADRARAVAAATMTRVRAATGLN